MPGSKRAVKNFALADPIRGDLNCRQATCRLSPPRGGPQNGHTFLTLQKNGIAIEVALVDVGFKIATLIGMSVGRERRIML